MTDYRKSLAATIAGRRTRAPKRASRSSLLQIGKDQPHAKRRCSALTVEANAALCATFRERLMVELSELCDRVTRQHELELAEAMERMGEQTLPKSASDGGNARPLIKTNDPKSKKAETIKAKLKAATKGTSAKALFTKCDTDGDGTLNAREFKRLVRVGLQIGVDEVSDAAIHDFVKMLDTDDSGELDLEELISFLEDDATQDDAYRPIDSSTKAARTHQLPSQTQVHEDTDEIDSECASHSSDDDCESGSVQEQIPEEPISGRRKTRILIPEQEETTKDDLKKVDNVEATASGAEVRSGSVASNQNAMLFQMHAIFNQERVSRKLFGQDTAGSMAFDDEDDSDDDEEDLPEIVDAVVHYLNRLMISPDSSFCLFWSYLTLFFVGYDCVMIPLTPFGLSNNAFLAVTWWLSRCFWSVDFLRCWFIGYIRPDAKIEMRTLRVMRAYAKSWFILDFVQVVADWADSLTTSSQVASTCHLMRMTRVVRMTRLTDRLTDSFGNVLKYFCGSVEAGVIFFGLMRIIFGMVWLNHLFACVWYGIATAETTGNNWVVVYNFDEAPIIDCYSAALYWSLASFMGNVDIYAQSAFERTYSCAVIIFAFVISAVAVSKITSSMTHLELLSAEHNLQLEGLRQYLSDNHISDHVRSRVQRYAEYILEERNKSTPEENIALLECVSEPLRMEMHFEIFMPVLGEHPFMSALSECSPYTLRNVCHSCISKLPATRGDIIFQEGEKPQLPLMYFITGGRNQLTYVHHTGYTSNMGIGQCMWACEPVLWTNWVHTGFMRAKTECTMCVLNADAFQHAVTERKGLHARKYAKTFVGYLSRTELDELTDVVQPGFDYEGAVEHSCPSQERVYPRTQTMSDKLHLERSWLGSVAGSKKLASTMRSSSNKESARAASGRTVASSDASEKALQSNTKGVIPAEPDDDLDCLS